MPKPPARLISCDEAGFTGPGLLDENQPVFAYAAHDLRVDEATAVIAMVRDKYRIQAPELKSKVLRRRPNWPSIALDVARQVEGRAIVIAMDKRLNLGGKAYEYLFEPVLEENSALFYRHNLHRFIMNAVHRIMFATGQPVPALAEELQAFMRTFEPSNAPTLFAAAAKRDESNLILNCMLRFSRGYADRIAARTEHLRHDGNGTAKWTLDLTTTCLFSLLFRGWGHRHPRIDLLCDDSKPLRDAAHFFDDWIDRDDTPQITDGTRWVPLRGNLANPIRFGSSVDEPTIQVADVLAGATADVVRNASDASYGELAAWVERHFHEDRVLPNYELINTGKLGPRVNLFVLRELAMRADRHADPLSNMEQVYLSAIKRFRSPAARMKRS